MSRKNNDLTDGVNAAGASSAEEENNENTAAELLEQPVNVEKNNGISVSFSDTESEEDKAEEKPSEEQKDEKPKKKKRGHKKLRHGAMSVIYTVIFIAVIVLVNVIATMLFERYPLTIDLTESGKYSISEQSEEYIKSVDVPVTIKIFALEDSFIAVNDYTKQADEVIKNYCKFNDNISVEYIDVDSNPNIVTDYADQEVTAYSIIVETNAVDENGQPMKDDNGEQMKRVRSVSYMDMIELNEEFEKEASNSYGMTGEDYLIAYAGGSELNAFAMAVQANIVSASTADEAFISAIIAVTDPDPVTATVLTGREEAADISYLKRLLLANGYTVNEADIVSEDIPEDTDLCIIPAPTADYMDVEIEKIDAFLDNGGKLGKNLVYIASLYQQETPNLDEFLEEYYVQIETGVIIENDKEHYISNQYTTICDDISETFADDAGDNAKVLIQMARPIKLLAEEKGTIGTEAYLSSTDTAVVLDAQTGEQIENGKQIYAATASKAAFKDDGTADYSNIFVLGSESIVSNTYMSTSQYQNREYILSVINGLTGKSSVGITVEPKVISGNLFDITADQISLLKKIFIGVIPALTLILGLVVFLRRKHR